MLSGCSIPGCPGKHCARGWCSKHWQRWYRYGDPLATRKVTNGERRAMVDAAIASATDECIDFPFSQNLAGYGTIKVTGRTWVAAAWVCTVVHGPRPAGMVTVHSCPTVNNACINPRHLRWDTQRENVLDMVRRGRHGKQKGI